MGLLGLVTWERHTGYFGPAFSPDGRFVYVVGRETEGATWGFGWEFFTPPAYAYPLSDHVSLVRVEASSGRRETLETWTTTPVARRVIREYRGRVFNTMRATVRPRPDGVEYGIEMAIPKVPMSDIHTLDGVWSETAAARRRGEWRRGGWLRGPSEPVLAGAVEVFELQGAEAFPCAVALLDHSTLTPRALTWSRDCAARYSDGPTREALLAVSRKADLDRHAEIARVRHERIAKHRADGLPEGDAILRSYRDLEDMGYLPRSPRLTARPIDGAAAASLPTFEIAEPEMASGIFPDIERAVASPGTEVEKSMGRYIVHRDYTTSARLNALLDSGARAFVVRYRGAAYRIEIR